MRIPPLVDWWLKTAFLFKALFPSVSIPPSFSFRDPLAAFDSVQEQLGRQCLTWLEDQVFSIREAATLNLQKLAQEFGSDWAKEHLVPQVRAFCLQGLMATPVRGSIVRGSFVRRPMRRTPAHKSRPLSQQQCRSSHRASAPTGPRGALCPRAALVKGLLGPFLPLARPSGTFLHLVIPAELPKPPRLQPPQVEENKRVQAAQHPLHSWHAAAAAGPATCAAPLSLCNGISRIQRSENTLVPESSPLLLMQALGVRSMIRAAHTARRCWNPWRL